jgi:hypothetical protein
MNTFGRELKKIVHHHYVITTTADIDAYKHITDLFLSMDIKFKFFEMCTPGEVPQAFVSKTIGNYNRRKYMRDYDFVNSKYTRARMLLTYYILWCHCQKVHPGETVMIWEDSIVLNNSLSEDEFIYVLSSSVDEFTNLKYDIILLGHFHQQFKTYYTDDGKSRIKCDIPVNGYSHFSQNLLKLDYSFPAGATIYSPRGLDRLIKGFEEMVKGKLIYPIQCFIANMMEGDFEAYGVIYPLFGQLLEYDSIVLRNVLILK